MTSPSGAAVDAVREQVKQYFETHITDARDGAVQHLRQVEGTAVDTVEATADRVTGPHVEAARLDREATAEHVVEAGGHAQDAAASAGLAAQHAEGVSHAEARAGEHEDLARAHEDEARVQAEASAGHADRSDGHAVVSQGWADSSATSAALSLVAVATVTQYVGDGFPEGKVAAPVGSIYTDRQATAGAIRWVKASGTGTTGWQVEYGDTGWRDLRSMYVGYLGGTIQVRRVNSTVTWSMQVLTAEDQTPSWNQHDDIVRPGFLPNSHLYFTPAYINTQSATGAVRIGSNGVMYTYGSKPQRRFDLVAQYPTGDAWPSTLPGVPS